MMAARNLPPRVMETPTCGGGKESVRPLVSRQRGGSVLYTNEDCIRRRQWKCGCDTAKGEARMTRLWGILDREGGNGNRGAATTLTSKLRRELSGGRARCRHPVCCRQVWGESWVECGDAWARSLLRTISLEPFWPSALCPLFHFPRSNNGLFRPLHLI